MHDIVLHVTGTGGSELIQVHFQQKIRRMEMAGYACLSEDTIQGTRSRFIRNGERAQHGCAPGGLRIRCCGTEWSCFLAFCSHYCIAEQMFRSLHNLLVLASSLSIAARHPAA